MVHRILSSILSLVLFALYIVSADDATPTEETDELRFTEELYDMTRNIGKPVTMKVSIEGEPPLNLFLFHDRIATYNARNKRKMADVETIYDPAQPNKLSIVYTIEDVKAHQAGIYKAQGESADGSVVVSTMELTLIDPCEDVVCGFRQKCLNVKGEDICTCSFDCNGNSPVCADGITYGSMCHLERTECRQGHYVNQPIEEGACVEDHVEVTEASCTLSGEGHVTKFNGDFFSFKGTCPYEMAKDRRGGVFVAYARTEQCGSEANGMCLRSITMYVDRIYGFSLERGWLINDNGKSRNVAKGADIVLGGGAVSITRDSKTLIGTIVNKGITFYYDGLNYFKITVPLEYVSRAKDFSGFCGPVPVDAIPVSGRDISMLGDLDMPALGSPEVCAPEFGATQCEDQTMVEDVKNAFANNAAIRACGDVISTEMYIEKAVVDTCSCGVNTENNYCFCNILYSYVEDCRQAGVQLQDFWGSQCSKSYHKDVFRAEGISYNNYRRWKRN